MADNPDMFSYLPNYLIFIIISFLPFKEAARTSLLSKRWRNIWHSTKNIEFNESFFVKHWGESINDPNKEVQRRACIDFAKKWIQSYREPFANKFRLVFSNPKNHLLDMQNFIHFAVNHKVKVLNLDFSDPTWNEENLENHEALFELPSFVYEHENLESVKFFSCNIRVSDFNNFQALKSLSLGWIKLTTSSFRVLLSNCRLLESLSLKKCWDLGYLDISSPSLKTLVIDKCLDLENGIRVDAPKLKFFKYSGALIVFDIEYLRFMVEAVLDFGLELEFSEAGEILCGLLSEICRIRVLTVCSYMLQVIHTGDEPLSLQPPLDGVQHLILKTALDLKEYYGISFFLNSCPHLEILSIHLGPARIFEEYDSWLKIEEHQFLGTSPYAIVYACMKNTLKVVNVKGFKGGSNELMVLRYLLKYGSVLENVFITISEEKGSDGLESESVYRQNAQKLLQFQRASPNLNILIH